MHEGNLTLCVHARRIDVTCDQTSAPWARGRRALRLFPCATRASRPMYSALGDGKGEFSAAAERGMPVRVEKAAAPSMSSGSSTASLNIGIFRLVCSAYTQSQWLMRMAAAALLHPRFDGNTIFPSFDFNEQTPINSRGLWQTVHLVPRGLGTLEPRAQGSEKEVGARVWLGAWRLSYLSSRPEEHLGGI